MQPLSLLCQLARHRTESAGENSSQHPELVVGRRSLETETNYLQLLEPPSVDSPVNLAAGSSRHRNPSSLRLLQKNGHFVSEKLPQAN